MQTEIKRGNVFFANLSPVLGSEQDGTRPVVIIQNDVGNKFSSTTIVIPITSQLEKAMIPTHVELQTEITPSKKGVALCEQIRTIDKKRLGRKKCTLSQFEMKQIAIATKIAIS